MALMIPALVPDNTQSAGERTLHPLLRDGLDESYTVFHSFRTSTPNLQGFLRDGEIDFLIFSPSRWPARPRSEERRRGLRRLHGPLVPERDAHS